MRSLDTYCYPNFLYTVACKIYIIPFVSFITFPRCTALSCENYQSKGLNNYEKKVFAANRAFN